jgi:hypothetical protein
MGLLTRAGDLVYTFRFLKLLVTQFEDTDAFKLGIIDDKGNKIKNNISTADERSAYTSFHRLVFNVKKLMAKAPGGSSRIASYAAALYLIKENFIKNEEKMYDLIEAMGIDRLDFLTESSEWFVTQDRMLSPGNYRVNEDKLDNTHFNSIIKKGDRVVVAEEAYPVGQVLGMDIYEAKHYNSGHSIYVTVAELYK